MNRPGWEARAARAEELAAIHASSAAPLQFYAGLARVQDRIHDESHFPLLLDYISTSGTEILREHAATLRTAGPSEWSRLIDAFRREEDQQDWETFFARVCLQPLAENNASPCPWCGRAPQVTVLRAAHDGARRSLVCSMCTVESDYRRIVCPRCGEEGFDDLPVYSFDQFDYIRVEACERCKGYLLSVDITKCPAAIPVVDELAAIPVNLWAVDRGYEKITCNILGL